jgi:hypothetical protein
MAKPTPCRVLAKPASRQFSRAALEQPPSRLSWPALETAETLAEPPTLARPIKPLGPMKPARELEALVASVPPPPRSASASNLWSYSGGPSGDLLALEEAERETEEPMAPALLPRRPGVAAALASLVGLAVVVCGGGLLVRAVPEASAASTHDGGEERRPGGAIVTVTPSRFAAGASCSDARPAPASQASVDAPVVVVPPARATDLGDLDPIASSAAVVSTPVVTTPAAVVPTPVVKSPAGAVSTLAFATPAATTPAASGRRPAKASAPVTRRATPAPARASAPAEPQSADVLFAGRL